MSQRAELLAIVEKEDTEAVVQFLKNAKLQGWDLSDTLAECSRRQREDMWECLRKMCTEILLNDGIEGNQKEEHIKQMSQYAFLDGLVTLATATIDQKDIVLPQALIDTAALLHGVLLTLPDEADAVKFHLAHLFELWWRQGLEGWEDVIANTLIYLLKRSLSKGTISDVRAVWRLHTVLPLINFETPSAADLKNLLGRCCSSAQYLKIDEGRRFLGYVMTLNAGLVDWLHWAIKSQIPYAPKLWLPVYGEIYFRAWQKSSGDMVQKIENDCIQDLMNHAIHSSREGTQPMASTLFRVMSYFHSQKKQRGVDSMLLRLYNPILWRALSVPNTEVRANSAGLLFDAFPLQDPDSTAEDMDFLIQKQFDFMQRLLTDPCPVVRALAVEGVCRILSDYLEMIPMEVVQTLLCKLLKELAWDTTSPSVRLAVVKGITAMLDNPMCHLLLKPLLASLALCLHDKAETVRVAMVELLLKVKGIRAIKYWSISPVEHLLTRMEIDSPPVVRRIVELLFPSFLPLDQNPQEQVSRCLTLLESNASAARVFFLNAPCHLTLGDTVKYMSLLCRYMLESVRSMSQHLEGVDAEVSVGSGARGSKRSREDKRQDLAGDEEHDESDDESDNGILTMEMLQGLLEAIFLMWTAVAKQLDSADNADLKQSINKKLSVTIPEVLKVTNDPRIMSLVVEIAGHLPPKTVPTISRGCLSKLRSMAEGNPAEDYLELLEAMCLWKMVPEVLQLLSDWLEDSLTPTKAVPEPVRKKDRMGKKCVQIAAPDDVKRPKLALDYLTTMLRSTVCKRILVDDHRPLLVALNRLLSHAMVMVERQLEREGAEDKQVTSFAETAFSLHLRLSVLLHDAEDDREDCVAHMKEVLVWGQEKLVPLQQARTQDCASATVRKGGDLGHLEKADLAKACVVITLNICSNMLMLGMGDSNLMTQLIFFCQAALNSADSLSLVDQVLNCLYQLLLFEELEAAVLVSKCMSHVLVAANACLYSDQQTDTKVLTSVKNKISGVIIYIISQHQSGDDKDVAVVTELTSTMLAAVLAELQNASRQDTLVEKTDEGHEALPVLSNRILASYSRNIVCRKILVQEAEKCVESRVITDVHTAHAMVHLLMVIYSKGPFSRDVDLGPLQTAVNSMVQQIDSQPADDLQIFRDVMTIIHTKLQKLAEKNV